MDNEKYKLLEKSFKDSIPNSLTHSHGDDFHLITICNNDNNSAPTLANLELFEHFVSKRTPFKGKWTLILKNLENHLDISAHLKQANLVLEFKQTRGRTLIPFYHTVDNKNSHLLSQCLGCLNTIVTNTLDTQENNSFNEIATSHNIPSLEVYVGPKGKNSMSHEYTFNVLTKALKIANKLEENTLESLDKIPLSVFEYKHLEKFNEKIVLKKFANFDPIQKDQVIGTIEEKNILASQDGVILFPHYHTKDGVKSEHMYILLDAIPPL